jgi:hypothetical protein
MHGIGRFRLGLQGCGGLAHLLHLQQDPLLSQQLAAQAALYLPVSLQGLPGSAQVQALMPALWAHGHPPHDPRVILLGLLLLGLGFVALLLAVFVGWLFERKD